jgi:serine/threonine-protein kinase SRPK3
MLTGDLLFQPRKNDSWGKNDDHLAQIQELIGDFDMSFILRTPKMRRYFLKNGKMKKFPRLDHYPL